MGRFILIFAAVACSSFVLGCEPETSSQERTNVQNGGGDGGKDAGLTEAGVDPNGGRDSDPASCFAACSNTAFTCQAKSGTATTVSQAQLSSDPSGCSGTIKKGSDAPVALKLDCPQAKVCIGSECFDATFSAMTYGYTADGATLTVCTRD